MRKFSANKMDFLWTTRRYPRVRDPSRTVYHVFLYIQAVIALCIYRRFLIFSKFKEKDYRLVKAV